jgi:hypothetical protein
MSSLPTNDFPRNLRGRVDYRPRVRHRFRQCFLSIGQSKAAKYVCDDCESVEKGVPFIYSGVCLKALAKRCSAPVGIGAYVRHTAYLDSSFY